MKKLLSYLLTASMTVMMLPVQAHAKEPIELETITENGLIYEVFSDGYELCEVKDLGITSVTIPATLNGKKVAVSENVFKRCGNLTEINVEEGNPYNYSIDGVLFTADNTLVAYPSNKPDISYTVPENTKVISKDSFYYCKNLKIVTFSDFTTVSSFTVFHDCPVLEEINGVIPENGTSAVAGCPEIRYLHFNGTKSIHLERFPKLEKVEFEPDSPILEIYVQNPELKEFNLPVKCESVYISECEKMDSVHISETCGTLNIENYDTLKSVSVSAVCNQITVENCLNLSDVSISAPCPQLSLNYCENLQTFSASEKCFFEIQNCKNLKAVRFSNLSLSDADNTEQFNRIIDCPALKEIMVDASENASSYGTLQLIGNTSLEAVKFYEPISIASEQNTIRYRINRYSLEETEIPKIISSVFCGNYTVYGWQKNDMLRLFCEKYNHPFQALDDTAVYEIGDVTGDIKIDILDVVTINKAVLGKESLTNEQIKAIDFNGNGKPDASDSLTLMKYIVGLIETLT